ncbi:MAG: TonB-dependent receptor [Candidatus Desulfofervidus auxilii]|nr:TonB-dependent receptor [Candidatus Desulfofervidus auxilii]
MVTNKVIPSITMIEDCDYEKKAVSLTTNYKFNDDSKVSFLYNFFNDEYTRGRPNVGGDWDRHFASFIYNQKLGKRFAFKGTVGYRYDDLLHRYDKGGTNYEPRMRRYTDYYETPIELQLTGDVGWENTLTGGFFYNRQTTDQKYISSSTGQFLRKNKYKVRTLAAYIQDTWKPIKSLIITAGIRYDYWKNYDNFFSKFRVKKPHDTSNDNWSPKFGIRYNFSDQTSIWANYGVGYKPPTPEQLYDDRTSGGNPREPNPNLKPEKTYAWELGVEKWFGELLHSKVVGFYNYTDDKILSWFSANNIWINKNIGRTKSYGVEIDMTLYLLEHWQVTANYTWNRATIDKNPAKPQQEGNYLPFCPKHKANLGITYSRNNFTVSGFARYLSLQHTNEDNIKYTSSGEKRYMERSFVVDLKATKRFTVNWGYLTNIDFSLSIDNLFDENYRTFYIYEDPGRVIFAELKFIF